MDVLAVLDRRIAECELREFCDSTIAARDATNETRAARTALDELIEKSSAALQWLDSYRIARECRDELRAALAAVEARRHG